MPMLGYAENPVLITDVAQVLHRDGWKIQAAVKSAYFADFLLLPGPVPCHAANVLAAVTSHTRGFRPCHGIEVSPSGRLPSRLLMPEGSLVVGIPAALRARQMTSLSTGCLAILPGAFLQTMT